MIGRDMQCVHIQYVKHDAVNEAVYDTGCLPNSCTVALETPR